MKTRKVLYELENALEAAEFKNCGFSKNDGSMSDEEFTKLVKERTELYRQTWIAGPIRHAIALIKEAHPQKVKA